MFYLDIVNAPPPLQVEAIAPNRPWLQPTLIRLAIRSPRRHRCRHRCRHRRQRPSRQRLQDP